MFISQHNDDSLSAEAPGRLACVAGALDLGARPKAMPAHDKPPDRKTAHQTRIRWHAQQHLDDCAETLREREQEPRREDKSRRKQGRRESNPRLPASEPALCVALLL